MEQNWWSYYWELCRYFGRECYRTWRQELFASVVVIFFTLVITGEWKDFRTASLATALTLAAFAIWHLLRAPWILERKDSSEEPKEPGFFAGAFGIVVIVGVFIGGYELAIRMWELRPVGTIQSTFAPPPQPIIEKGKSVIVHGACKLTAEQINPARLPQPCSGPASPTLRDRVLAINAHMTEGDRNRFSNALSEFEESLKEGESILYRLSNEGNVLQRERQDGTIAKDVKAHQKVLSDIAADGWKYYRSFPALRVKWQTIFSQQTEYIFGDNPDNGGSGLLLNAEEAYRNYLGLWNSIQNREQVLDLLGVPQNEFQEKLNAYARWRVECMKRLSEMRDSIR